MKRIERNEKTKHIFLDFQEYVMNQSRLIINELKEDTSLDEEAVINILLDFYNRGATQTKLLYPCIMCNNSDIDCLACNELIKEVESYK
ncbi:MAG: hypothetical protein HC854_17705 [Flavobacterium sp.]|nr:hypothetical protein [Flavobacterium sp.]